MRKPIKCLVVSRVISLVIMPVLLLTLLHVNVSAQAGNSTFVGTVTDQTGAVVPGAKVTIVNQASGVTNTKASSSVGAYEIPFLENGTYTVKVELAGFQVEEVRDVKLDVRSVGRVDFSLKPAKTTTEVTVRDSAPLLTTDSADVGSLHTVDDIQQLPMSRDFAAVQLLTPGVTRGYDSGQSWGLQLSPGYAAAGGGLNSIDFSIDGADNNRSFTMHNASSPSLDMIAEVKVDTGGMSAEYGRGSAAVEVALKSGTNRFHGAAFDYLQNDKLNARYKLATEAPNPLKVNQYGASLGGPIVKNKLFFMFGWTATKDRDSSAGLAIVPSADQWAGKLSTAVVDPLTGNPFPNTDGYTIPASRISPFATAMKGCCSAVANDGIYWRGPIANTSDRSNYDFKTDYVPTASDSIALSLGRQTSSFLLGQPPTLSDNLDQFKGNRASLRWTHIFRPNLINTLVAAGHGDWTKGDQKAAFDDNDFDAKIGLKLPKIIPGLPHAVIPTIGRMGGWFGPLASTDSTIQLNDTVRYIKGKHSFSFGGEVRRMRQDPQFDYYTRGIFAFYGGFTGSDFGDFLLGTPSIVQYAPPTGQAHTSYHQLSGFVQDNWRVTSSLTLNIGLRYEYTSWPVERDNMFASIIPETGQVALASSSDGKITSRIDQAAWDSAQPGTFIASSKVGLPRSLRYPDYKDWSPRIGFAYQPSFSPSTTVRGSYGISYNGDPMMGFTSASLFSVQPFTAFRNFSNSDPTLNVMDSLRDYSTPAPSTRISGDYFDPHMKMGYYENWGLNIQHAFPGKLLLDVGYQGSRGVHITMSRVNYNESKVLPSTSDRFPGFTTITGFDSNGNSSYNAMTVKLKKEITHGLTFTSLYTWSKALDDGSRMGAGGPNIYNTRLDWGPSAYSHTHVFSTDLIYQLPFGKGKQWGSHLNPVLEGALGGWQLSGVLYASTGDFLDVTSETALANIGTNVWPRADRVKSGHISNPTVNEWFDTSAFAAPACCRGGNSGRGVVVGPGSFNPDFALAKSFGLGREGYLLQFRADAYNAFNHASLGNPGTLLEGADFGKIATYGGPRTMQMGLKFQF